MSNFHKQVLEMMMESQYWPPATMLDFQRSQLSQLLKHAHANSPFYKERLKVLFDHNGEVDWRRWNKVPITKRNDLRDRGKDMLAVQLPPGHAATYEYNTSGSSGVPISVTYGNIFVAASQAARHRAFSWHDIDYRKMRAVLTEVQTENWDRQLEFRIGKWGPPWQPIDGHGEELIINHKLDSAIQLAVMGQWPLHYLSAFPIQMELIARINRQLPHPVQLECVLPFGQETTEEQVDLFKDSFNARCMQMYSSKEGGKIAFQCPGHGHFHINAESMLLEILDEQDQPCPPGKPGRIIITPFFNSAQPVIRYEQGDVGVLGETCDCGRTLPVLKSVLGRLDPIWRFPDGRDVAPKLGVKFLRESLNALAFQVAQVAPMILEVRYVPASHGLTLEEAPIRQHIHEMIRPDIAVQFKELPALPTNAGGKTQRYTNESNTH
jgi:phenylacetate-CoA ligase